MNSVHYMSSTNEWATPQNIYNTLNAEFGFTLDPCATRENAKCARYFTSSDNGLLMDWGYERVFMNPPYGREIGKWIEKAYNEKLALVVCLIPAQTDTSYFHEYCMRANEIRFIRGRLKFGNSPNSAPFPSCIVVFRAGRQCFAPRISAFRV